MNKLEELEKALRKYQELLKNAQMGYAGQPGGMTQPSEATMKAEDEKEEKKDKKKDKKMIEEKLDEHNEKKHGEPKDEDSAMKFDSEDLTKSTEIIHFNNNSQWSVDN